MLDPESVVKEAGGIGVPSFSVILKRPWGSVPERCWAPTRSRRSSPFSCVDLFGHRVRADDRRVELAVAHGLVAAGARAVGLRARGVIRAGDEVRRRRGRTGTRPRRRVRVPDVGLRGLGRVAAHAVADVLREDDVREVVDRPVVPDDDVRRPGLHARQVRAAVDLVDHHLEVDRVSGVRVDRLRLVAGHAELDVLPRAAVRGERSRGSCCTPRSSTCPRCRVTVRAVGTKVVLDVVVVVLADDVVGVARRVDREGRRLRAVEALGQHRLELVDRVADRHVGPRATRVGRGLRRLDAVSGPSGRASCTRCSAGNPGPTTPAPG